MRERGQKGNLCLFYNTLESPVSETRQAVTFTSSVVSFELFEFYRLMTCMYAISQPFDHGLPIEAQILPALQYRHGAFLLVDPGHRDL